MSNNKQWALMIINVHMAVISLLFLTILKDERKHDGAVDKSSNNKSVLWMKSAFVMLKTGHICH